MSMIAAVTNQGKTRWMIIDESFNSDKRIEFLQALIKDCLKKVFFFMNKSCRINSPTNTGASSS